MKYLQDLSILILGLGESGLAMARWCARHGAGQIRVWDSREAMQAYEQSAVFRQEIQPTLQPFFVGEYTTHRCEVKYEQ